MEVDKPDQKAQKRFEVKKVRRISRLVPLGLIIRVVLSVVCVYADQLPLAPSVECCSLME